MNLVVHDDWSMDEHSSSLFSASNFRSVVCTKELLSLLVRAIFRWTFFFNLRF